MKRKSDELTEKIYEEIKNNPKITQKELAKKYFLNERTIRRYIKYLKTLGKIKLINFGTKKIWQLLE